MNYICTKRQTTLNKAIPKAKAPSDELSLPWSKPQVVYTPWRTSVSPLVKKYGNSNPRGVGKGAEKEKRSAKACENIVDD